MNHSEGEALDTFLLSTTTSNTVMVKDLFLLRMTIVSAAHMPRCWVVASRWPVDVLGDKFVCWASCLFGVECVQFCSFVEYG